ncbi:MAG: hypothetical protein OXL96_28135 [Candidatus Poribacteria bacterium]|nr:hypothetical protein [Candidatus Poribacteria bacterium]
MHFFRESLTYTDPPTAATPAEARVFNRDLRSAYTFSEASAIITLTFAEAVSLDNVWMKVKGLSGWSVSVDGTSLASGSISDASVDSFIYSDGDITGTVFRFDFTRATATPTAYIYEIWLLPHLFSFDVADNRPTLFLPRGMDPGGIAYRSENGTLISYAGQSGGKRGLQIRWDYLSQEDTDRLEDLFYGPPVRKPFTIFPQPLLKPNEIYVVRWQNDFVRAVTAESIASGYTIEMLLEEI